ncbi:MAG: sugar ABC transporter ATP-binding protein [Oscillospiraceae bacterium]
MKDIVLEMDGISKSFPGVKALDNMRLTVYAGEVHALMGENGAGKSTLMNILCGAYSKDAGEIRIDGQPVNIKGIKSSVSLGISMIHQELNYVPALTVADNIFLGKELTASGTWMKKKDMLQEAQRLLDEMEVHLPADSKMYQLSVSQRQMVEITRAISNNARILIMDEPTSAITSEEVEILFRIIDKLKQKDVAIIYISHKMNEIFRIADRITIMRDGNYIDSREESHITEPELISLMVGREINEMFPKNNRPTTEEIFRAEGLTGVKFEDISFKLNRGEILGIAGLMGAGRTEIMRAIFGLDPLRSGHIYLNNKQLSIRNTRDALDQGIGYVSEDRRSVGLVLGMSVKDNLTMSSLSKYCKHKWIQTRREKKVAEEQIEQFAIKTPGSEQLAANLSGGNQQKIVLSKTLLCEPEVIILDEPTRGIDVGAKAEIHRMISELANSGKGIIMISSEMPEILGMSDRIVVIHEGRKKGELTGASMTQESIMQMMVS